MIKIGLIREGKIPPERRVALTPKQSRKIMQKYPKIRIVAQSSPRRAYMDEEYNDNCIIIQEDLSDCDILVGIKEIPVEDFIEGKTYFLFSHTAKKQEYNKEMLKAIIEKKITLIDYEYLKNNRKERLIGFGRFAGIVGTYNAIHGWAIRNKLKEPRYAYTLEAAKDLKKEMRKLELPPLKIAFTGEGRVAKGVRELLESMNMREVSVEQYLTHDYFDVPVFVQLAPGDYYKHKEGLDFDYAHFQEYADEYDSNFNDFTSQTDLFIYSSYWDPNSPELFTKEDMRKSDFRIKLIADITCEVGGAIPSTLRAAVKHDPFYGYNPETESEDRAFVDPKIITVMSLDNLSNELPREASKSFGKTVSDVIFPAIVSNDKTGILERATIVKDGKITKRFDYLEEWVNN